MESKTIIDIFIGLLSLYPGICLGYFVFHRFFIIYPSRKISMTPKDLGLNYEEIYFRATDNLRLHGWFINAAPTDFTVNGAQPLILFFPGNDGTVSKFLPQMSILQKEGFHVFMFGYRGFGKSSLRWPSEAGVRRDAHGAWNHLTKNLGFQPSQIIFYAQSLGCGVASWAAGKLNPAALILEGGFTSVPDFTSQVVPWLPVRLLTTQRFDTRHHLEHVTCPVLIAHSIEDQTIPFTHGEKLYETARDPKDFLQLSGLHAEALESVGQDYILKIKIFLKSHF